MKKVDKVPRVPRKKGQHRGSKSHSDLYTDENPKGTIKDWFTVKDLRPSVSKINGSGKSHTQDTDALLWNRLKKWVRTTDAYLSYIHQ